MPRKTIDKTIRKAINDAKKMIAEAEKADCNEAETRRRVERIFESIMGYDALKHLSREQAVHGAGETEHADFAIKIKEGPEAPCDIIVEVKRVAIDLAPKHLKQVTSYAIDSGCEWVLLTNGRDWRLYHISFGKPPITKMIYEWDLLTDDVNVLAERFDQISYKQVKKGALGELWQKMNVLHPRSLLGIILSENVSKVIRRELKKESGVNLAPEDILAGVRRLLNDSALSELSNVRICLEEKTNKTAKRTTKPHNEAVKADPATNPKSSS